jgi:hypothetical protein
MGWCCCCRVDDALEEVIAEKDAVVVCAYFGRGVAGEEMEAVEEDGGAFWAKIAEEARSIGEGEEKEEEREVQLG